MNEQLTLGDFAPPMRQELSQYFTPQTMARKMVEWAGVRRGQRVLEPSAGGGSIVRELLEARANVTAYEIDPAWVKVMRQDPTLKGATVVEGDFLEVGAGIFDLAVANPPLNDGVAAQHIANMLELAPRVVSLLRAQDLHGQERYRQLWSRCDLAGIAYLVRRPVFSGDGGATEFVVVDVRRVGTFAGPQHIEHWVI
jgi:predicted RNA methylase